jgi:transaldolase/glucose-6-phosphate isomerase
LITSGELQDLVNRGGVLGVTSNPAIFEKAIAGSGDYDPVLKSLVAQGVGDAKDLFERIAIEDIQLAADVLYPVYLRTQGLDGYLSLEVSPYLACDTDGTVEEALRLREAVGRDNLMMKVPATPEGIQAIEILTSRGVSVNVTLLFCVDAYREASNAYLAGLETFISGGGDPSTVSSVASYFISRIDAAVDQEISLALDSTRDAYRREKLKSLLGTVAISNAKVAYAQMQRTFASERWQALESFGARRQRLLWASTGAKNPKYSKTLYVDELIGPDTINTVPVDTYREFEASGSPRPSLTEQGERSAALAAERLETLALMGISLPEITDRLLDEGVQSFSDAFDKLLGAVERKRQALLGGGLAQQTYSLGDDSLSASVNETLDQWRSDGSVRRLWARDSMLWSGSDEAQWLGWLGVVQAQRDQIAELRHVVHDITGAGFQNVVLLGMGGSSLFPDVLRQTFGQAEGFPELLVLDSVVPAQIKSVEARIELPRTLFVVSSKSGGTTETRVLMEYFLEKMKQELGDEAGSRFLAITDPGTQLHKFAKQERFDHILHGDPTIGGRYSALSNFGMLPAALMGVDVEEFLDRTEVMMQSCAPCVPPEANPGVALGVILGRLAQRGRDKLTLITTPGISSLGAWIEQLVAESTGKNGKGIIPVDGEKIGPPSIYGEDRVFVYARLNTDTCLELDASVAALEAAGQPVVRVSIDDSLDLGQAVFRWEIATAVAGSILELNPFDQPDVEAAKIATRRVTASYEESGELPSLVSLADDGDLRLFADEKHADALRMAVGDAGVEELIAAHLGCIGSGDYFAINAYLEMNAENHESLQAIRHAVRSGTRAATTLGYGPRFLHSTGQLHKGGPRTGVFLQITAGDAEDIQIPGQRCSFGTLKLAQSFGDMEVLAECGRRVLRVHLGSDEARGLELLQEVIESAFG